MYKIIDYFFTESNYSYIKSFLKVYNVIQKQKGFVDSKTYRVSKVINGENSCSYICLFVWESKDDWVRASKIIQEDPELQQSIDMLKSKILSRKGTVLIQGQVNSPPCNYTKPLMIFDEIQIDKKYSSTYIDLWQHASKYMSKQKGYISSELLCLDSSGDTELFLNLALWGGEKYFNDAFNSCEFQSLIAGVEDFCSLYLCEEIQYDN